MTDVEFMFFKKYIAISNEANYISLVDGKNVFFSFLLRNLITFCINIFYIFFNIIFVRLIYFVSAYPDKFIHRMFYTKHGRKYKLKKIDYLLYIQTLPVIFEVDSPVYKTMKLNHAQTTKRKRRIINQFLLRYHNINLIKNFWNECRQDFKKFKKQIKLYIKEMENG